MDTITITKKQALEAFNGNGAELGRALGLTRQAVAAWPDGPIHERHALKLRFVLRPDLFGQPPAAANDDPGPDEGQSAAGEGC